MVTKQGSWWREAEAAQGKRKHTKKGHVRAHNVLRQFTGQAASPELQPTMPIRQGNGAGGTEERHHQQEKETQERTFGKAAANNVRLHNVGIPDVQTLNPHGRDRDT